jgi:hypothetical protein
MKRSILICVIALTSYNVLLGQTTCTIIDDDADPNTPISWNNSPSPSCAEGGNANSYANLIVPDGITIDFDTNGDTWSGNTLTIQDGGTIKISFSGQIQLDTDVVVESGGYVDIVTKLLLGSASGCGYTISLESGANLNVGDGASDRLNICGTEIARGSAGGCNPYPAGPLPYCEPAGGFVGPLEFDQTGLPVILNNLEGKQSGSGVSISWSTSMEENFSEFLIEHSIDGKSFTAIGSVTGQGEDLYNVESEYSFVDPAPYVGRNYYRLKAVDLDNTFEFFGPVMVTVKSAKSVQVYPNPSKGGEVFFVSNFYPSESDRLILVNQLGIELANVPAQSRTSLQITRELQSGIYYLKYIGKDFSTTTRVIVSK